MAAACRGLRPLHPRPIKILPAARFPTYTLIASSSAFENPAPGLLLEAEACLAGGSREIEIEKITGARFKLVCSLPAPGPQTLAGELLCGNQSYASGEDIVRKRSPRKSVYSRAGCCLCANPNIRKNLPGRSRSGSSGQYTFYSSTVSVDEMGSIML